MNSISAVLIYSYCVQAPFSLITVHTTFNLDHEYYKNLTRKQLPNYEGRVTNLESVKEGRLLSRVLLDLAANAAEVRVEDGGGRRPLSSPLLAGAERLHGWPHIPDVRFGERPTLVEIGENQSDHGQRFAQTHVLQQEINITNVGKFSETICFGSRSYVSGHYGSESRYRSYFSGYFGSGSGSFSDPDPVMDPVTNPLRIQPYFEQN